MKKSNLILQAALALAFAGASGMASAVAPTPAVVSGTATDFALETCQNGATVYTLPSAIYTVGDGGAVIQDFYVTFTIAGGSFTATPTATVTQLVPTTPAGTATYIATSDDGKSVTFRINASAAAIAIGDKVKLSGFATSTNCATAVTVSATNGLLFLSGEVQSPVEAVSGTASLASFTQAVTITMPETGNDSIDLTPADSSLSRLVFGPAASLDIAVGTSPAETITMLARQVTVVIGLQKEPDNVTTFSDTIDAMAIRVQAEADLTAIASLCLDNDDSNACDAGETFNLTTGLATIASGWGVNGGLLLNKTVGAAFSPRTLTLNYALDVKTNAIRPGMTEHTYSYTAPTNNNWPIVYGGGALLRSPWFMVDASTQSTMRLVNAGMVDAVVANVTYFLDDGTTGAVVGVPTMIPLQHGKNTALTATAIPTLGALTASRGYIEVVIAGSITDVDGQLISYATSNGSRTVVPMRNVTFDTGLRSAAPF